MKDDRYNLLLGENNPLYKFPMLYEAAVDEFSKKSYEDASLNAILKDADMSKGSFYHHFIDKLGLYLAVLDVLYRKKIDFFAPLMAKRKNSGNFFDTIRDIARNTMNFMFEDARLYHFSNRALGESKEFISKLLSFFSYDFKGGFGELIQSAIDAGQINKRYSAEFLSNIIEVLFMNMHRLITTSNPDNAYTALNQVIDILQFGAMAGREEQVNGKSIPG